MSKNINNFYFKKIIDSKDKRWDWKELCKNPSLTMDTIKAYPNEPWNWGWLAMNSNITWDIVETNPDKPWDWNVLLGSKIKL